VYQIELHWEQPYRFLNMLAFICVYSFSSLRKLCTESCPRRNFRADWWARVFCERMDVVWVSLYLWVELCSSFHPHPHPYVDPNELWISWKKFGQLAYCYEHIVLLHYSLKMNAVAPSGMPEKLVFEFWLETFHRDSP
jgi:hypothetical protein